MKIQLVDYSKLHEYANDTLYIYKWEKHSFYAIWKNEKILLVNIPQKYNHLFIITRKVKSFKRRLFEKFSSEHVSIIINKRNNNNNRGGFIIPEEDGNNHHHYYTPKELVDGKNKGIVVQLYCQWAHILYKQIREKGKEYFFINALSQYQSLSQCFLNHFKIPPKGLFLIRNDGSLKFISDDIFKHFPFPFKATSVDLKVIKNNNNNTNIIKTCTISTILAHSFFQYENKEKIIINCNNNNNDDDDDDSSSHDDDPLQLVYDYLSSPTKSGIILTGWNESLSTLLRVKINNNNNNKKKILLSLENYY